MSSYTTEELSDSRLSMYITMHLAYIDKIRWNVFKYSSIQILREYQENIDLIGVIKAFKDYSNFDETTKDLIKEYLQIASKFCSDIEGIFSEALQEQTVFFDKNLDFDEELENT